MMPDQCRPLGPAANVFLDAASAHAWEALNEHVFLSRVLVELRTELGEAFDALNFFVFSPAHAGVRPASADLPMPGKVLIYLSDESSSVPHALAAEYLAIFKAYLPHDLPGTNIFALNLGYVGDPPALDATPILDRPIDMFFSGNLNGNRLPLLAAFDPVLRRLPATGRLGRLLLRSPAKRLIRRDFSTQAPGFRSYIRFTDGFMAGLDAAAYAAMLTQSKIVLCPRGFSSTETFRHVEAMRAGAIVASEPLPDTHLYRGAPLIEVRDWRPGLAQVRAVAGDPARLADLSARSRAWYDSVFSERATARFMAVALTQGLSFPPAARYDAANLPPLRPIHDR